MRSPFVFLQYTPKDSASQSVIENIPENITYFCADFIYRRKPKGDIIKENGM